LPIYSAFWAAKRESAMKKVSLLCRLAPVLFLFGCGSGSTTQSTTQPTSQFGTPVQMLEKTACEDFPPSECSGLYGFAIDRAGNFNAGPSPTGVVSTGTITSDELNTLSGDATSYLASVTQVATCPTPTSPAVGGEGDVITLLTNTNAQITILGGAPPLNCGVADPSEANALSSCFQQLREKYYPIPFPAQ
jgi:hypothetical protein